MRRKFLTTVLLSLGLATVIPVQAQTYPNQPVDMVVPFPPGTGTDTGARLLATHLQKALGQPFVVTNKPGAGGSIGAMEVVRADPDGYTLLFSSNSAAASNVALLKSMPYDPVKDLTPIAGVSVAALVLMVPANHPAKNLDEFIAYLKEHNGKVSAGYGSSSGQVGIALLNKLAGVEVLSVPYKGIPQTISDTIGGVIDFTFVDMGNAKAQVEGGKLRALGITSAQPSTLMPEWRPIDETLPGFDIIAWLAVFGPANMPAQVVDKLSDSISDIVKTDEIRQRLAAIGMQPLAMGHDALGTFVQSEIAKWKQMAKDANIEPR